MGRLLTGCQSMTPPPTSTPDQSSTPSLSPTLTPEPLGSPANPIIFGFVLDGRPVPRSISAMEEIAQTITEETGISVVVSTYPGDIELFTALQQGGLHIAWLYPLTYIHANNLKLVQVGLLTNHFGTYFYGTQFLANVESGFSTFFDRSTNLSTVDAATALAQFEDRRPCWVEPGSLSGFILPLGILEREGIEILEGVDAQTHTSVIRALYIKGVCDFGATFAISGDPRTSSLVIDDLTDAVERVVVVWQSDAEIPNLNLSYSTKVPSTSVRTINDWFIEYIKTVEGRSTLTRALNDYDVQDLRIVDDSIYDPLRNAIDLSGVDPRFWVGR